MFETSKHVPKPEKCCCVFKDKLNVTGQCKVNSNLIWNPDTSTCLYSMKRFNFRSDTIICMENPGRDYGCTLRYIMTFGGKTGAMKLTKTKIKMIQRRIFKLPNLISAD